VKFAASEREPARLTRRYTSGYGAWPTLRLLSLTGYDPETAYYVLQATGTGAVVIGPVIPLLVFTGLTFVAPKIINLKRIRSKTGSVIAYALAVMIFGAFVTGIWIPA
jgi:hypothetical protein